MEAATEAAIAVEEDAVEEDAVVVDVAVAAAADVAAEANGHLITHTHRLAMDTADIDLLQHLSCSCRK